MKIRLSILGLLLTTGILLFFFNACSESDEVIDGLPRDGLIAYYPFNNNAEDESMNNHNGTIYGAVSDQDRLKENNSLFFDGIDDYVELDKMDSFNASLESFSLSFWINSDTKDKSKYESVMKTINQEGAGTMFSIEVHRGSFSSLNIGVIRLDIRDNNDTYFTIYVKRPDIFDGTWHNITYTITSAKDKEGDVYIDGELERKNNHFLMGDIPGPEEFDVFDFNFTFGGGNNRGNIETFFRGSLDEIAFYNRPLNTNEINQLFKR